MNAASHFAGKARDLLSSESLERSGAVLYSGASTLKRGDLYILGVNPGGDPDTIHRSVRQALDSLEGCETNSYLDEDWGAGPGRAPLQERLAKLVGCIGLDLRAACASNIVFMRSRDMSGIDFWNDARACWPVHELVLEMVRPTFVLAFGNSADSPYAFLKHMLAPNAPEDQVSADHGTWRCRGFEVQGPEPMYVAGVPHLSRYSPLTASGEVKPQVAAWLRDKLAVVRSRHAH